MTTGQWLTFDEALKKANEFCEHYKEFNQKNILLANGFSIDCCKDIFTYKSLFENADFSDRIKQTFSIFNTNDFEKIIKLLQQTYEICSIYNFESEIIQCLKEDAEKIKNELATVISKKHPEHQHKILDSKFCSAYKFLSNFTNIFTLNYDMLLYWTLMYRERGKTFLNDFKIPVKEYRDGFGRPYPEHPLSWYRDENQNVFYLHGALHLFDDAINIIKTETTEDFNLMDSIKERLDNEQYPLIVTEGNSKDKLEKISHNKYLQNSFDKLKDLFGCIFIHGHSLDANDKHILKEISRNHNIKQVYISIFEPEKNYNEISSKAYSIFIKRKKNPKELFYYDATSANIWDSISEEEYLIKEFGLIDETEFTKLF